MTILDFGDLTINGETVSYEAPVKVIDGSIKRVPNPQVNGQLIYTSDISENRSQITINVRVTPENNDFFDTLYANGDNNTITFRDKSYVKATMEMIPEREDQATVDYVFFAQPLN